MTIKFKHLFVVLDNFLYFMRVYFFKLYKNRR